MREALHIGLGRVVPTQPPGITPCRDGKFSTLPHQSGVCSYHGGSMLTKRRRIVKEETKQMVDIVEVINPQTAQVVDVVEVPVIGVYRFSTYTTQKGKTDNSIEIQFKGRPDNAILNALKEAKFWYSNQTQLWIGWDTPERRAVVQNMPLALDGELVPVLPKQAVAQVKRACAQSARLDIEKGKIGRNRKRALFECIFGNATEVWINAYEDHAGRTNENMGNAGDVLKKYFDQYKHTTLHYKGDGEYMMWVHSNLTFRFKSNLSKNDLRTATPNVELPVDLLKVAAKFEQVAAGMDNQIEAKFNPAVSRQNPTARRAAMATNMMKDGENLQRIQAALYAMAESAKSGTLPAILHRVNSKALVENILQNRTFPAGINAYNYKDVLKEIQGKSGSRAILSNLPTPYSDNWVVLTPSQLNSFEAALKIAPNASRWAKDSAATMRRFYNAGITNSEQFLAARQALLEIIQPAPIDAAAQQERKIQQMIRELIGVKIPGYFNSPPAVVDQIVSAAKMWDGARVLEPSAGAGDIADEVRRRYPNAKIDVIEPNFKLREILQAKGYNLVENDLLSYHSGRYDFILMNPPFENLQDIAHIQHAYKLLAPNGRLVSITSESPFFRSDKAAVAFRDWLDDNNGYSEKLPDGSFLKSRNSTGVNTRLVVIDKPSSAVSGVGQIVDTVPPGKTACWDGKYSTFGHRAAGGVCSYHGGRMIKRTAAPTKKEAATPGIAPMPKQAREQNRAAYGRPMVIPPVPVSKSKQGFKIETGSQGNVVSRPLEVPAKDYTTNAITPTLSTKAQKEGDIWFTQQDAFTIQANVKIKIGNEAPNEYNIKKFLEYFVATQSGYEYTRYKMGSYGGIYVLERYGKILTNTGADFMIAPYRYNMQTRSAVKLAIHELPQSDFIKALYLGKERVTGDRTHYTYDTSFCIVSRDEKKSKVIYRVCMIDLDTQKPDWPGFSIPDFNNMRVAFINAHKYYVWQALQKGKDVPPQVTREYPDLQPNHTAILKPIPAPQPQPAVIAPPAPSPATAPINAQITRARVAYLNLINKKSDVSQYARTEKGLFDELAGIRRTFNTQRFNKFL